MNLRRDHWRKSTSVRGPRSGRRKRRSGGGSRKPEQNPKGRPSPRGSGDRPIPRSSAPELRASRAPHGGLRDEREKITSPTETEEEARRARAPGDAERRGGGNPSPTTRGPSRRRPQLPATEPKGPRPPERGRRSRQCLKKKRLLTMDTSGLPTTKDAARCDK